MPVIESLFAKLADEHNYRLEGDRKLAPTWRGRAEANVAAICLAQSIEEQDRPATPIEQTYLARFIGFGASDLANGLFPTKGAPCRAGWEQIVVDLNDATTPAEWAALARATQYAHFTPEFICRALWQAVHLLGFRGGSILEPGCGTGLFLATMPDHMVSSSVLTGIEADPITARIARLLFPRADIREGDFTDPDLRLAEQDLAIGNPPFSDRIVRGAGMKTTGLSLHEYFVWRSVQALRPGGLAAFVVSRYLMDKAVSTARDVLGDLADFLGAVRLPAGSMRATAGTDVVVDLVFLRRRPDGADFGGLPWATLRNVEADGATGPIAVNRYFADHPDQVLGQHAVRSGQFGPTYTVEWRGQEHTLEAQIAEAILRLHGVGTETHAPAEPDVPFLDTKRGVETPVYAPDAPVDAQDAPVDAPPAPSVAPTRLPAVRVGKASEGATIKEGSYLVSGDHLYQVIDAVPKLVQVKCGRGTEGMFASHAMIIRGLIPIRDAVRMVLRAQEADKPWEAAQARLEDAYTAFVKRHGPINKLLVSRSEPDEDGDVVERSRRPNIAPMMDDPDCWLIAAIEEYDPTSGRATRGPIFTQRVISPPPEHVIHNAVDALAVVLNETGDVDIDRMAEILSATPNDVIEELGAAVYRDPATQKWETDDAYLSGQVRTKLTQARAAAEHDQQYERNVEALVAVQPPDLNPSEITARLGVPWIPAADVMLFVLEVMGVPVSIDHTPEIASWSVDLSRFKGAAGTSEWGTARRDAGLLLEDALNSRVPQVYDHETVNGVTYATLNPAATEAAKEKLNKIKAAFLEWVWTDTERSDRLARIYNDTFNNLRTRRFTGEHLMLPGASTAVTLRPHQKRVIWRIISAGSTYIAHTVGAGKTFAIAAALMEQRRLGLIDKPMLVVPGHCLAQFSREFAQLYPNASILVADETNFSKAKRSRFLARAATGIWDAIIITHSAFKFIAVPIEFERALMVSWVANYEDMLTRVATDDRVSRKRLERMKEGMLEKLKGLQGKTDNMLTLAEIGIDQIIVDEAQEFRKLNFATNMAGLRGIDPNGSQRAWDLFVKTRFVEQKQPRRPLILSSGTPITNTMGEMYTLQRFMQPSMLADRGVQEFDAWALTFGDTRTELELQPSGLYKPVTRFSEFVNVPELVAMFRAVADVVQKDDLREFVTLPRVRTGQRQLITAPGSDDFKAYQKVLANRIKAIEERHGPPKKGDDILLSVITDGRHAAIDLRLVDYPDDEPGNKLNLLIANVHRIWQEAAANEYFQPNGKPYDRPGAAQMIFSDLGTLSVEDKRGFSAYRWIKDRLVEMGVPGDEVAFMQHHKTSIAKQRLLDAVVTGQVRILIGSSETMGTGVNVQARLAALHHLDVPWLPSQIGQREGRIERQGNQHAEIDIYAYATLGSLDASMWQTNERKARFIAAVLAGDRSIRRLEDMEAGQANQFAMAKAIASGDARLMQKAGLEADIARLQRQRDAHYDDQYSVRYQVNSARENIASCERAIPLIRQDMAQLVETAGDRFEMTILDRVLTERKEAGAGLLALIRRMDLAREMGTKTIGSFAGFDVTVTGYNREGFTVGGYGVDLTIERNVGGQDVHIDENMSALGLIARMERRLDGIGDELWRKERTLAESRATLADYAPRLSGEFPHQADLDAKLDELHALNADLAATKAPAAKAA
jgi:N12 class adenine-specific DNA methylase/adenine-specific DNA methylase